MKLNKNAYKKITHFYFILIDYYIKLYKRFENKTVILEINNIK